MDGEYMGKTFCLGDIHGNYGGLLQCLERAGVDEENDLLIPLGDVCDGYRSTKQVIDTLLKYNTIHICGNHECSINGTGHTDFGWFLGWAIRGEELPLWMGQGGYTTCESYGFDPKNVPTEHIEYLLNGYPYYIIDDMCFVHGGIRDEIRLELQHKEDLMWDRSMAYESGERYIHHPQVRTIFCGHTSTYAVGGEDKPQFRNNVIMVDTGSGWRGRLTIMDVSSKEYWQSDYSTIEEDRFIPDFEFTFGRKNDKTN